MPEVVADCRQAIIAGDYVSGLNRLRELGFWNYLAPQDPPNAEGLSSFEHGRLLLYCGILYSFWGITKKNAQEISKNLLTKALYVFEEIEKPEFELYCCNFLALSYWRMGNVREAEACLSTAMGYEFPPTHLGRLHSYVIEGLIFLSDEDDGKILARFNEVSGHFESAGSDYLTGLFYLNQAVARKNLQDYDGALIDSQKAAESFQKCGNPLFLINAENNLAYIYRAKKEFQNAFASARRALANAEQLGDLGRQGSIYDTMALISLDAQRYDLALEYADKAISLLVQIELYDYLIKHYETKIRIQLQIGRVQDALNTYAAAYSIAVKHLSVKIQDRLARRITDYLERKFLVKLYREGHTHAAYDNCHLAFDEEPPTGEITCVEVISNHYCEMGLEKGCLAVIEETETRNGDFVAILNSPTNTVYFGFADTFLDLIQLDTCVRDAEALTFSTNVAKILGKVYGYCLNEPEPDGCLRVVRLDL